MAIGTPVNIGTANGSSGAATTMAFTVGSAVAAGSTVIIVAQCTNSGAANANAPTSVADSKSNTYASVGDSFNGTTHGGAKIFSANLATALTTSDTITVTFPSGQSGYAAAGMAVSGVGALDTHNHTANGTTSGTQTVSTGVLAQAAEIVIGVIIGLNSGDLTNDAAFTALTGASNSAGGGGLSAEIVWAYKTVAATTSVSYSPTQTVNGQGWGQDVISFKAATANTLSLTAGAYALTGAATTLLSGHGYQLVLAAGSYVLTGAATTLTKAMHLSAAAGSYAITGAAATLRKAVLLTLAAGSYAITGKAIVGKLTWHMTAAAGSYVLTGKAMVQDFVAGPANLIRKAKFVLQKLRTTAPKLDQ